MEGDSLQLREEWRCPVCGGIRWTRLPETVKQRWNREFLSDVRVCHCEGTPLTVRVFREEVR